MKAAAAISHGRVAPCFAGVEIWIVEQPSASSAPDHSERSEVEVISTHGWHPLGWGRELMRHDVGLLLCAGIEPGTWAAVRGHGIEVIPHAMGDVASVLEAWRKGMLSPPSLWPANPKGCEGLREGRGRRRFHGRC